MRLATPNPKWNYEATVFSTADVERSRFVDIAAQKSAGPSLVAPTVMVVSGDQPIEPDSEGR